MEIGGLWVLCQDNVIRPTVIGDVVTARGSIESELFVVDTGADRTILCWSTFQRLGFPPIAPPPTASLSGLGGTTPFVLFRTSVTFMATDGTGVIFHRDFIGVTDPSLEVSLLGRDFLDDFDVIVSRRRNEVWLLSMNHRYTITA